MNHSFVLQAILSFIAVSLDEFFILALYFLQVKSQSYDELNNFHVIFGQLFGFTIILVISLFGALSGSQFISMRYLTLIGIIPLCMGMYDLVSVYKYWAKQCNRQKKQKPAKVQSSSDTLHSNSDNNLGDLNRQRVGSSFSLTPSTGYQTVELSKNTPDVESNTTIDTEESDSDNSSNSDKSSDDDENNYVVREYKSIFSHCCHPQVVIISAVIIADGAEEIGVFMPILTSVAVKSHDLLWTVLIYYVMIAVQCFLAYSIVNYSFQYFSCSRGHDTSQYATIHQEQEEHINVVKTCTRYSKNLLPFLLIALGCYVLQQSILAEWIAQII